MNIEWNFVAFKENDTCLWSLDENNLTVNRSYKC